MKLLLEKGVFFDADVHPFLMSERSSLDIDNLLDFKICQLTLNYMKKIRVLARLDIKSDRLIKGVHL